MKKGKKTAKVPNLRFPGFEGDWEETTLGDCAVTLDYGMNAAATTFDGINKYIRITDIDENSSRYKSDTPVSPTGIHDDKYLVKENDILFARTGASTGKSYLYDTNDGKLYFAGFLIRARIKESLNAGFIFNQTKTTTYYKWIQLMSMRSGQPGINSQEYSSLKFYIPSKSEQDKIAQFLSLIDERIQAQNKIIEELNTLKTTAVKRIFSKQLRFKNTNGDSYADWDMKKMGDITTLLNKRNKSNEKLPVYSINNKLGFIPQNEQFDGVDSGDRGYDITLYKIIDKNTFAYNPARINVGSIGYSGDLENIIISSLYVCFQTKDSVNDDFLFQYLKTEMFNKKVLSHVEGGVREYLFYENFARIKLDFPHIEEQVKIASFLSSIDSKILSENEVLQRLEEQKKFLLRQLFV